jgi:hypothetical protein
VKSLPDAIGEALAPIKSGSRPLTPFSTDAVRRLVDEEA